MIPAELAYQAEATTGEELYLASQAITPYSGWTLKDKHYTNIIRNKSNKFKF